MKRSGMGFPSIIRGVIRWYSSGLSVTITFGLSVTAQYLSSKEAH